MLSLTELEWPRHTERLTLRPARFEDLPELWTWYGRPEVGAWLTGYPPDEETFIAREEFRLDELVSVAFQGRLVARGRVAVEDGRAQLEADRVRDSEAEIGWTLDPSLHGRGLGTELARALLGIAFDGLGLHRVVAFCYADNVASWKVMEKVGMRREAHHVADSLHRDGRYVDSFGYALLAEEWRRSR